MYPTVVIILVETQRSMTEVCEISPSNTIARPATLGNLSFVVVSVHSTTDKDAESRCSRALQNRGGQEHGLEEVILEVKESQVVSGCLTPL